MKNIFKPIVLFALVFIFSSLMYETDTVNIIQAGGYVKSGNKKLNGVLVKIYSEGKVYTEQVTDRIGRYSFILQFNKNYRIVLAKEGYLKSIYIINTAAPEEVVKAKEEILWQTYFEMYEQMPGMTMEYFPKPMASYMYDNWFIVESNNYEKEIEPELTELEKVIEENKQVAFIDYKQKADSLLTEESYEEAVLAFNSALELKADAKDVKKKRKSAQKMLKKSLSLDEEYAKTIADADKEFIKDNFDEAIALYQKAVIYNPKETYPTDKLYQIDSIKSYRWIEKNNLYEDFIELADSMYKLELFDSSLIYYSNAANLFEEKSYPKEMAIVLDSLVKENTDSANVDTTFADSASIVPEFAKNDSILPQNNTKTQAMEPIKDIDTTAMIVAKPDSLKKEKTTSELNKPDTTPGKHPITEAGTIISDTIAEKSATTVAQTSVKENIKEDNLKENFEKEEQVLIDTNRKIAFSSEETEESIKKLESKLKKSQESGDIKTSSIVLEEIGMIYQTEFKLAEALESYEKSLELKRAIKDKDGEADIITNIASVLYDSGSYDEAIESFEQSLEVSREIDDKEKTSDILVNMATVYENTYRYKDAIDLLVQSVEIKEALGDIETSTDIKRNIGNIYYEQNDFSQAIEAWVSTLEVEEEQSDAEDLSETYNSLGAALYRLKKYDKAVEYYDKSLEITRKTNNLREQSITLNNLGNINFDLHNFTEALDFYEQSLKIKKDISFYEGIATTLHNMGNAYYEQKDYNKSIEYFTLSLEVAEEHNFKEVIWRNYEAFAKTYAKTGKYKSAYDFYKQYTQGKYELNNLSQQIVELKQEYESSKIAVKRLKRELQKQNRIARYEAEQNRKEMQIIQLEMENKQQLLEKQRNVIISFIAGMLLILGFSLVITRQYQQKNKAYKVIAEQQRHIMDGISYASLIQNAVLPTPDLINEMLPDMFLINKPREVVSGDFYWAAKHYGKNIIAVADCTGHGVPGGFMSMLGIAILNEIISVERPIETNEILENLRERVMTALHQQSENSDARDGMDITLIMFDPETNMLQFSGAYHSLYHIRNGELDAIKGDRMPIGYHRRKNNFTSKTIQLQKGDLLYMSSDGYIDQIGHENWERFMAGRFKETLIKVCSLPINEQKEKLEEIHLSWRGNVEQTDDIMLMGIRI